MISISVSAAAGVEGLRAWRTGFRSRLSDSFAQCAAALLARVRARLSGEVLAARSGRLRAGMGAEATEDARGFQARVYSDANLPYARIHEYGGKIGVPAMVPKNAGALVFAYGGRMVFAKHTRAHVVDMPERSYMRSSLAEFEPVLLADIRRLAAERRP